jgi:hypothetical protein
LPRVGRWSKGAGRGALSLLRRTAPLPVGVLRRGQSTQTAVWPELVIVLAPGFDQIARFGKAKEKMFIEAFVAEFAVEAFDEGVLHRLAGLNVVPGDPLGGPAQHRVAGQFGTVVADDGVGPAALVHHRFQLPHHARAAERSIHHRRQTLAAEVVQYAQHAEAAAVGQRVGNEVERLPVISRATSESER